MPIRVHAITTDTATDRSFALFELSETPEPTWIVRFEECLSKHSGAAVAVAGRRVRVDLRAPEDLARLEPLVQRCVEEANLDAGFNCR